MLPCAITEYYCKIWFNRQTACKQYPDIINTNLETTKPRTVVQTLSLGFQENLFRKLWWTIRVENGFPSHMHVFLHLRLCDRKYVIFLSSLLSDSLETPLDLKPMKPNFTSDFLKLLMARVTLLQRKPTDTCPLNDIHLFRPQHFKKLYWI